MPLHKIALQSQEIDLVQSAVSCGREVTSEVLQGNMPLSIYLNDPEKALSNVMINFVNDAKAYKATKKESLVGRIAGGPYETVTRFKWQMKFNISIKRFMEKSQS